MKTIAIIPARGGSRRIPRKNVKSFHGLPMIHYPIKTARESGLFDEVYVSTDDSEITDHAHAAGALVMQRPPDLCRDEVGTQEVAANVLRALLATEAIDAACVIYPCTPMLTVADLERGWRALQTRGTFFAFGVAQEPFGPAGAFYWGKPFAFLQNLPLEHEHSRIIPIPPERCVDVDTPHDWARAEEMYARLHGLPIPHQAEDYSWAKAEVKWT